MQCDFRCLSLLALLAALVLPIPGNATTIRFTATDLPDNVPGEDLWQYAYQVSAFSFDSDYGFTIFFDHTAYSSLESPPPSVNTDWDPLVAQPDTNLPHDGFYDALALVDGASLGDPFTVSFVWLGQGSPGSQPFVVYEPGFGTIESGQTVVPEPSILGLVLGGILALAVLRRTQRLDASG